MLLERSRGRVAASVLIISAMWMVGCGGTVQFTDTASLKIEGTPPAPPPPPPAKPKRVEVTQDAIVIKEKIQFELDKATIKHESDELLEEIAAVFKENPQIKKVSIEGHTDSQGDEKYNQKLSEKRAAAVKAHLVKDGVEAERLVSKGWGETKLLDKADTSAAHAKNRRVEFLIVEQDEVTKTVEVDPKTGKPVGGGK